MRNDGKSRQRRDSSPDRLIHSGKVFEDAIKAPKARNVIAWANGPGTGINFNPSAESAKSFSRRQKSRRVICRSFISRLQRLGSQIPSDPGPLAQAITSRAFGAFSYPEGVRFNWWTRALTQLRHNSLDFYCAGLVNLKLLAPSQALFLIAHRVLRRIVPPTRLRF